jgi:(S)-citramalyl-CoA lyase
MDVCFLSTSVLKFNPGLDDPGFGCDVVLLDLEDSVHVSAKSEARNVLATLDLRELVARGRRFGIRLNCLCSIDGIRDLDVVYAGYEAGRLPIDYLHIPKVQSHHDLLLCRSVFDSRPTVKFFPLIETPEAVEDIDRIAALSDIMMFGQADMTSAMYRPNEAYLAYARGRFCIACARECIPAIDTRGFTELADMDAFARECASSRAEGFTGKSVIHPKQVPVVNKAFAISADEIEQHRLVVRRYAENVTGFTIVDGQVIAPPFVAKAEKMLRLYGDMKHGRKLS